MNPLRQKAIDYFAKALGGNRDVDFLTEKMAKMDVDGDVDTLTKQMGDMDLEEKQEELPHLEYVNKVSTEIELYLYQKNKDCKRSYTTAIRDILFNLNDKKNPEFNQMILSGEIKPRDLANMDSRDMASPERKEERIQYRLDYIDASTSGSERTKSMTDEYKCGKCYKRETAYFLQQTRSADEPMTIFITCINCKNRWKM